MKDVKRYLTMMLVLVMSITCISGCSSTAKSVQPETPAGTAAETPAETVAETPAAILTKPANTAAEAPTEAVIEPAEQSVVKASPVSDIQYSSLDDEFFIQAHQRSEERARAKAEPFRMIGNYVVPIPEEDIPGCDMTPYLQKVITVKGENLYVISVDERDSSKAFCMLVYPEDTGNYLPVLNPDGIYNYTQDDDKVTYQQVYGSLGYSSAWYEESYGDRLANAWAEQSELGPYMWTETIGIGDTFKKEERTVDPDPNNYLKHIRYDQYFEVTETDYTSLLERKAYVMSVEEIRQIDLYNWVNYSWFGDRTTWGEQFWLRTIWDQPEEWDLPGIDLDGNEITTTKTIQNYAVTFEPNDTFVGTDEFDNHANDAIFQQASISEYHRPAIACNVYNLTEDMITINYDLMPKEYRHRFYIDCRNIEGENVGLTFSLGRSVDELGISGIAGECTIDDGFIYLEYKQDQHEEIDSYILRLIRAQAGYGVGGPDFEVGRGGKIDVIVERPVDVQLSRCLPLDELVKVTNPYEIYQDRLILKPSNPFATQENS